MDGAIGALLALAPAHRRLVRGMERADSVTLDLHKWLHVPFEAACVLVRDRKAHREAFALTPEYLEKTERGLASGALWFSEYGLQLSRGFRALKVWLSIKEHGLDRFGRLIDRNIAQAHELAAWYKFKNKRLNDEENSNRLSFQQYKDFTKKVLGNYLNVPGWANQLHFNTSFSSTITDSEITTKTMKTWGPGNYPANYSLPGSSYAPGSTVMWIQNSEGRILQNMLQMYVNHAIYLDQLTYALIISNHIYKTIVQLLIRFKP